MVLLKRSLGHALHTKYRMLNIFGITCVIFVILQQTLRFFQRPPIAKPNIIPRKIWQSWKVDALHFEERDLDRARTWARKNPTYRYELLTDYSAVPYVEEHFGNGPNGLNRPDIVATYKALNDNLKIIQADLLRYIIMYVDGGLWADIDVEDIQPIRTFIPRALDERDIDMVIGIETDEPGLADHPTLGSKAQSFCQWTFMCKPGLPVMMRLIENILVWLHGLAEAQGKPISELHLDFDEVLSGTGPSAFTRAILDEMSFSTGENLTWNDFHGLVDSTIVGGVLVLPSEAFAAGTGHSGSGNHQGARALVKHHFHASSWTSKHQRFKHPVYDEVERCNWDIDCVRLWDANVAFYDSLPESEKLRMIELKRIDEAKAQKLEQSKSEPADTALAEVGAEDSRPGDAEEQKGDKEGKKSSRTHEILKDDTTSEDESLIIDSNLLQAKVALAPQNPAPQERTGGASQLAGSGTYNADAMGDEVSEGGLHMVSPDALDLDDTSTEQPKEGDAVFSEANSGSRKERPPTSPDLNDVGKQQQKETDAERDNSESKRTQDEAEINRNAQFDMFSADTDGHKAAETVSAQAMDELYPLKPEEERWDEPEKNAPKAEVRRN